MTQVTIDFGAPPRNGWQKLVSELLVENLEASIRFWTTTLGFRIAYQRPEDGFVYLERPEGAQIMLCRRAGLWETAALERPYGRGVMFQIYVESISETLSNLSKAGWPLYAGPREVWRRWGDRMGGKREIFVQDPDGYLIMIAEDLGERPAPNGEKTGSDGRPPTS
jgi:catechol 2,3-dioxygenase-like lactoylglutathione lyase family enzyme